MSQQQKEQQPIFPTRPGRGFGHGAQRGPVSKPKNFQATLKRLWQSFGREKRWLPLVFVIVLVDGFLMLLAPYLIGKSIDAMTGGPGSLSLLSIIVLALLSSYVLDGALTFLQGWMVAGITQRIVTNMRQAMFEKLQKLPVAFFDSRTHGELMSR